MAASKKRRRRSLPWKTGTCSWDITNLKQSIFVFWYLWSDEKNSCRYYPLCFYHIDNSMFLPHPGPQGCSFLYEYDCSQKTISFRDVYHSPLGWIQRCDTLLPGNVFSVIWWQDLILKLNFRWREKCGRKPDRGNQVVSLSRSQLSHFSYFPSFRFISN
jgi:hypothetical protein